jgi:hypothetical protein
MQKSAPSPRKAKSAPSPRKAKSAPLPRKTKSATSSPKKPVAPRKTLLPPYRPLPPPNISTIPDEIRLQILDSVLKFPKRLDNKLLLDYFKIMSNVSKVNKSFSKIISSITLSWNNITIINLRDLEITKAILGVLNMTNSRLITTIILHNISFDTADTRNKFLEFFSKNTMVVNLIFDEVAVKAKQFLPILQTFNRLKLLEISKCDILYDDSSYDVFHNFIKILINSKSLEYLTFTNNTIDRRFYTYLFTQDKDNEAYINNTRYMIHVSKEFNNKWGMIIKSDNGTIVNNFEVNIVGNVMTDFMNINNYRNDFAKYVNFP